MKKFKGTKKIIALLLSLSLITGMMPATAFTAYGATGNVIDAAIFCSDVHGNASTVTSVFKGIKSADSTFNPTTASFVGDTQTTASSVTSAAQSVYSGVQCIYAFGNHDDEGNYGINDFTGLSYGDSSTNYYIYTISENDMSSSNPDTSGFTSTVEGLDKTKPLFIISHMPLHKRRNDNNGAATWYTAISAAAKSMDIAFFWAHNHTGDNEVDQAAYYVAKNGSETITLQGGSAVTPNFTYLNAGYIDPPNTPARNNVATAVRIYDDSVNYTVYNASGELSGTHAVNETVAREFASTSGSTETTKTLSSISVTTKPTKTEYIVGETIDTAGMVVTATYSDDSAVAVTGYTVSEENMDTAGTKTVTVTYTEGTVTKTTTFEITVVEIPTDAVLTDLTVEGPNPSYYFIDDTITYDDKVYLNTKGLVVKANYTLDSKTYSKPLAWDCTADDDEEYVYSLSFDDLSTIGKKTGTVSFGEKKSTFEVWACAKSVLNETLNVGVTFDTPCILTMNIAESTMSKDNLDEALKGALNEGYAAYDFTATYAGDYNALSGKATVTVPATGLTNPAVYYVSEDGKIESMPIIEKTDSAVTFTTTHFSTFVVGESTEIVLPENETATGTSDGTEQKTVYVLTSTLTSGEKYLIVDSNSTSGNAIINSNNSVGNTAVTINSGSLTVDGTTSNQTYIVLDDSSAVWTAGTNSSAYTFINGSYYLYHSNGNLSLSTSTSKNNWTWNSSNNYLYYTGGGTTRYLTYSSGWNLTTTATCVYLYKEETATVSSVVSGTYSIAGEDVSAAVSANSNVNLTSTLTFTPDSGEATTEDVSTTATYEIVTVDANGNTVDGDPNKIISRIDNGVVTFTGNYGKALVKVSYKTEFGTVTDYITVEAKAPYYTIQLHEVELEEAAGVTADNFANGTYYTYNSTTGFYSIATEYVDGTTYYVNNAKQGDEITETVALKGIEKGDTYSVWAVVKEYDGVLDENGEDGADLGELGDALTWSVSDESIATIDTTTGVITFTGENYGTFTVKVSYKGADRKVITDTITISATESLYIVPGDGTKDFPEYPNEGAVRFDKNATAVGNFSETGIAQVELSMTGVPYTTGNEMDVVLMLDMTGSMDDVSNSSSEPTGYTRIDATIASAKAFIKSIVINEDGSYNDNRIGIYVFNKNGASTMYDLAAIDTDAKLEALIGKVGASGTEFGADYTEGKLDTVWTDYGVSGGTPYDDGLSKIQSVLASAKTDGTGNDRQQFAVFMTDGVPTDYEYIDGTTHANYSSASSIAGMLTSASDYATRDTDYKYEYYSTEMKNAGVTVYSVGVGLYNENNAWSGTATQCGNLASALLNDISGPANEAEQPDKVGTSTLSKKDSYFFSVDDADAGTEMVKVFENIATSIKEAATDVVVEDKIGNDYDMNFSIPGYGTDNALGADALDGLSEFYVQAVEYKLDANKARTDEYTVLENFTFNQNGTFKSHTVDGVACNNCTHVTASSGKVTKIDGTYFDYKSDNTGEYITWKADKLTDKELALQYFAYLNDSSGVDVEEQIAAGTYYTNEYATLTYNNYNGNRVQQEFPVPQMTWNGAQVSYVFYLVNEAGQPVNRAGRVVPFSEAQYVTDVFTKAVVWNDLEQLASLDAKYEAAELVPEVYSLYDDDAKFNIHVYEDQSEVNLNNHFVIDGDVTDEYNTTPNPDWNNANTTYVFNSKTGNKYNVYGTYSTGKDYLCKGEGTVSGVTFTEASGVTIDNFANAVYYKYVNGKYVRELYYTEETKYYSLTAAEYTPLAGETHAPAADMESTTGGTVIGGHVYYVDENGEVYTIVEKSNGIATGANFDYSNTTVAFAVVWKPQLEPDTVVVDYGLDVVVDVIENDALAAGVTGVMATAPNVSEKGGTYDNAVGVESFTGGNGLWTASKESMTSVRFEQNEMGMKEPVKFYYEAGVNYYKPGETDLTTTNMYSSVTVIPATTIYYEDSFVDFKVYDKGESGWTENTAAKWDTAGTTKNATQATDRPGQNDPVMGSSYDAENVYGYDGAYDNMSTYSMGSSRMLNVNANRYGTAEFEFWGTGFDVIALTSNDTGTITVQVQKIDENGNLSKVKNMVVDTYYGYTKNDKGEWVVDPTAKNPLYQVPVIESELGEYDHYKVTIKAAYNTIFDHVEGSDNYDMYIDAIRIYDPANDGVDSETVREAYVKDGEGWPTYVEVRDLLIEKAELDKAETVNGIVFIDGVDATANVADYKSYGPNNEVYLATNQSVAFDLELPTTGVKVKDVQIGLKSADGNTVSYSVSGKTGTLKTATGMYYSILDKADDTIVITNTSGGILSVTDVKITYESDPYAIEEAATPQTMFRVSKATIASANEIMTEDPKVLSVKTDKDSYEVGETITVTVKTNTEAEYVTVNGVKVTSFIEDGDMRSWTFTQNAATGGKHNYFAEAFNGLGESAQAKVVTVVVEEPEQEEPDTPVTPEEPDTPVTPEDPETPVVPENPVEPEEPETPPVVEEPEEPVAAPAKIISLKTDKQNYVQGDKVKVTVTTNKEATKVKVGTKVLKNYTTKNGNRTWTTTVNATKLGKLTIGAIAYNSKGTATNKVTKVVTVKKFAPRIFNVTLNKYKVKKGQKYTVTVKAGSSVKHVRVNGKKITKFTTKNGVKTFKVTFKANKVGKQKVKVIAYNKALYPTNPKVKTITVTRK